MFYQLEKLQNRINELASYRYRDVKPLDSFYMYEPEQGKESVVPTHYPKQTFHVNDTWSGRNKYVWLNTSLHLPEAWSDKRCVLFLDVGRTGGGNNSGFEALLFVNKQPFQGVDSNHQEVLLPKEGGNRLEIDVMMWSGLEGGGTPRTQYYRFKQAWYGWLDQKVDAFYFQAKAILEAIGQLDVHDATRVAMLSRLNQAFASINWTQPGNEQFYDSVYEALERLERDMEHLPKHSDVHIHAIGHSHIDLAWLWQTKHTKEKAKRTFSTVLRLMDLYPDYVYLQSQPQLYQWMKEEEPKLYEAIKQKVDDGQWEVEGGMWVEADCNIPSGESLVRQLLYGKRFFKKEFHKESKILWLPDVFGYSWALPQILKKSGIDTFMTTKISWNQYNRMPNDTFYWRGLDGTEILTHFITTPEPGRPKDSWFYTYNGLMSAETIKGTWEKYRDKAVNQDLLLAYGYGDGGGGVNREMLEMKRQLDQVPGVPHVKSTHVKEYFHQLHENVANTAEYVHTWDGELYLEYHRGTYTSQAKMKKKNRQLEFSYREAEILAVTASAEKGWDAYPGSSLEKGWKLLLLNQFHDIIPGSSIKEVYEDAAKDYTEAAAIQKQVVATQEKRMVNDKREKWTFFHPYQYDTPILVTIPKGTDERFVDQTGHGLSSQQTANNETLVLLEKSIPFAYQTISRATMSAEEAQMLSQVNLEERRWETPWYQLEWNDEGQFIRMYDKLGKREWLAQGKLGNVFKRFEDKPLAHDAWDIDLFYQEKSSTVSSFQGCELIENGPLRTTVLFRWKEDGVVIKQAIRCYRHTARIDFATEVDWQARQQLLKVEFPVDIRTNEAIYDIQFGNLKRPTHWNTSWDMARFETVGHKWAAIAEADYGISLLNDSKYGYSIKDNVLSLSLLKGAIYPDPEADIGNHQFTYALYPFQGPAFKRDVEREATYLQSAIIAVPGEAEMPFDQPLFTVSSDQVIVDAIKKSEDGTSVIIRLHEMEGARATVKLDYRYEAKQWREVNLIESEALSEWSTRPMELTFTPYEIKTIELTL
jgi:alpha-mannosidase